MRLQEYINLTGQKPYKWADANGIPRALVYAWLHGAIPTLRYLRKLQDVTKGAVRPDDFDGHEA